MRASATCRATINRPAEAGLQEGPVRIPFYALARTLRTKPPKNELLWQGIVFVFWSAKGCSKMPRNVDLSSLKKDATRGVTYAMKRYSSIEETLDYFHVRWIAQMTAVEIHAVWERYVEGRLIAALNHAPHHFLKQNDIIGVSRISRGLASYVVRGGGRFFDFRSTADLIGKANVLLGQAGNPFASLTAVERSYIDCLAAIRNCVVHGSAASFAAYKKNLKTVYGISAAPEPDEFLKAKDFRAMSPARNKGRIYGIAHIIKSAIHKT